MVVLGGVAVSCERCTPGFYGLFAHGFFNNSPLTPRCPLHLAQEQHTLYPRQLKIQEFTHTYGHPPHFQYNLRILNFWKFGTT